MTAQLCRMRREDGFDPHVFTSDVQYGQASHPFVKMRDDRPVAVYTFVAVVYLVICLVGSLLAGRGRSPEFR